MTPTGQKARWEEIAARTLREMLHDASFTDTALKSIILSAIAESHQSKTEQPEPAGAALLSKESEEWTVEDRDLYIELVDHEGFGIVTCKNRGFAENIAAVHNDRVASLQRKLEELQAKK